MGRRPTPYVRGGVYHIYSRGNNKQRIFLDDRDYLRFLAELDCQRFLTPFVIYAYCLMPNHFHLVVRVLETALDRFLQPLLTRYSKAFNRRWERVGHVFQDRFGRKAVTSDAYFKQAVAYVHYNPVEAGLAADASGWPWSSHSEYLGLPERVDADYALSLFAPTKAAALGEYLAKVQSAPGDPMANDDLELQERGCPSPDEAVEAALAGLMSALAAEHGLSDRDLVGSGRSPAIRDARRAFALEALRLGHNQREIASALGRSPSSLCEMIARWRERQSE